MAFRLPSWWKLSFAIGASGLAAYLIFASAAYCSSVAWSVDHGPTPITAFQQENNPWMEFRCVMHDSDGNCTMHQTIWHDSWTNTFSIYGESFQYSTGSTQRVWAVGSQIEFQEYGGCIEGVRNVRVDGVPQ